METPWGGGPQSWWWRYWQSDPGRSPHIPWRLPAELGPDWRCKVQRILIGLKNQRILVTILQTQSHINPICVVKSTSPPSKSKNHCDFFLFWKGCIEIEKVMKFRVIWKSFYVLRVCGLTPLTQIGLKGNTYILGINQITIVIAMLCFICVF